MVRKFDNEEKYNNEQVEIFLKSHCTITTVECRKKLAPHNIYFKIIVSQNLTEIKFTNAL